MNQHARRFALLVVGALATASACGGGGGGAYGGTTTPNAPPAAVASPADGGTITVGVLGDRGASSFSPNPATAKAGQRVAWRNQDGTVHRIVQDKDGNDPGDGYGYGGGGGSASDAFDSGNTAPGATSGSMSLNVAGTVRYHCAIHPGMTGSILVTN
jgi:plastocyanin